MPVRVLSVVAAHFRAVSIGGMFGRPGAERSPAPRSAWQSMLRTRSRKQRDQSPESSPQPAGGPDRARWRTGRPPGACLELARVPTVVSRLSKALPGQVCTRGSSGVDRGREGGPLRSPGSGPQSLPRNPRLPESLRKTLHRFRRTTSAKVSLFLALLAESGRCRRSAPSKARRPRITLVEPPRSRFGACGATTRQVPSEGVAVATVVDRHSAGLSVVPLRSRRDARTHGGQRQ